MPDLDALLTEAEAELLAWCTGERSWINEMMNAEPGFENRPQTLALIEARDADAIRAARERVEGLRALRSVQVPVTEEWEYGVTRDPGSAYSEYTAGTEAEVREYAANRPHLYAARRRKAGPWEPLPSPGTTTEEE